MDGNLEEFLKNVDALRPEFEKCSGKTVTVEDIEALTPERCEIIIRTIELMVRDFTKREAAIEK